MSSGFGVPVEEPPFAAGARAPGFGSGFADARAVAIGRVGGGPSVADPAATAAEALSTTAGAGRTAGTTDGELDAAGPGSTTNGSADACAAGPGSRLRTPRVRHAWSPQGLVTRRSATPITATDAAAATTSGRKTAFSGGRVR